MASHLNDNYRAKKYIKKLIPAQFSPVFVLLRFCFFFKQVAVKIDRGKILLLHKSLCFKLVKDGVAVSLLIYYQKQRNTSLTTNTSCRQFAGM